MPELPEVETIRGQLAQEIIGDTFTSIAVLDKKVFIGDECLITGEKVRAVERAGKYLFVHFISGKGIQIHLKMTGRLLLNESPPAHTRISAQLSSGRILYYWDTRRFGYWWAVEDISTAENTVRRMLGSEPWDIDGDSFHDLLKRSRRPIKDRILDQRVIAGVGNIYANDALWKAGIHPIRPANTLTKHESEILLEAIRTVLERGKTTGGASDNTYRDFYGNTGSYQNEFLVYGKTKGQCLTCASPLHYVKVGGRGTWYCLQCQK